MADEQEPATGEQEPEQEPREQDDQLFEGAENPDAVRNAIRRQKDEAKAAKARAAELERKVREYEDRDKSEQQKLEERASTAERRAQDTELKLLRFEVAAEKGVPLAQAHRLQGSSKEEIVKDADAFLKDLRGGNGGGQLDGGARRSAPGQGENIDSMIRRMAGREP